MGWQHLATEVPPARERPVAAFIPAQAESTCPRGQPVRHKAATRSDCVMIPTSRFSASMIGMWW